MARTRTTTARTVVLVEHRDLPISGEARRRISQDFEAREASRGRGRAQVTQEPERKRPTRADNTLRDLLSRGYSQELAEAMLDGRVPSPVRTGGGGWKF